MTGGSHTRFALTDEAIAIANHTRRTAAQLDALHPGTGAGQRIRLKGSRVDARQFARESAILRLMAITEAYVDALSIFTLHAKVPHASVTVLQLMEDYEIAGSKTWQARETQYLSYLQLRIKDCDGWATIVAARDVRNCLAHGQGRLTASQRQKRNIRTNAALVGVSVVDNRMHVGQSSIEKIGKAVRDFVLDVDKRVSV